MKQNIYFVGFMGCGKTTIGTKLATYKGKRFQDLDECIVEQVGTSIATLFATQGENYFRQIETEVLLATEAYQNTIIATGGGVIETPQNRVFLKQKKVIYLDWPFEVLYERVEGDMRRPLVQDKATLQALYERRKKLYEEVASDRIICEDYTPYTLAHYLAERIR